MRRGKARPKTSTRYKNRDTVSAITNSGSQASNTMRRLIACSVPKGLQFLPDVMHTWAKTRVNAGFSGSATYSNTYHVNSPAFTFGPQINFTGAFSNNYPAGLEYLFGTNGTAGSAAPYGELLTYEFEVYCDVINVTTVPVYFSIVPSIQISLSAMATPTIAEQRGAVQILIPQSQTSVPMRLSSKFKLSELTGISESEIKQNPFYRQRIGTLPSFSAYLHLVATSSDGTTSVVVNTSTTFVMRMTLGSLNTFASNPPS